ncbi:hypothetical protein BD311DRAFT_764456 [Dichomitus squalens]|uniref:Uncharacterized protein n=1 Tax=Dichomitus squalens TaxID=114155 RepID=A0A4Q9MDY4_9APHY|nr:hypothetical protein BD311DRAFT_764456 [Dichomitus squalens]
MPRGVRALCARDCRPTQARLARSGRADTHKSEMGDFGLGRRHPGARWGRPWHLLSIAMHLSTQLAFVHVSVLLAVCSSTLCCLFLRSRPFTPFTNSVLCTYVYRFAPTVTLAFLAFAPTNCSLFIDHACISSAHLFVSRLSLIPIRSLAQTHTHIVCNTYYLLSAMPS